MGNGEDQTFVLACGTIDLIENRPKRNVYKDIQLYQLSREALEGPRSTPEQEYLY